MLPSPNERAHLEILSLRRARVHPSTIVDTLLIGSRPVCSNWVVRAQPVPYSWIPEGTPRGERSLRERDPASFRVPR